MLKINIVCVGTLKEDYWTKAIQEYTKRISRFATINIVEVAEKDIEQAKILIKENMEKVVKLSVPLIAEIGVGYNWRDAH